MNSYGGPDILELKEVKEPEISANDVLIRTQAVGLNAGGYFSMRSSPWLARMTVGFPRPKDYIRGWDVAGTVERVGGYVTRFQPGDQVFAACESTLAELVRAPRIR